VPENDFIAFPTGRTAERPHRLEERNRLRITVQVVDGKLCCELKPAGSAGGPEPKT
jgi:hypothetical protein